MYMQWPNQLFLELCFKIRKGVPSGAALLVSVCLLIARWICLKQWSPCSIVLWCSWDEMQMQLLVIRKNVLADLTKARARFIVGNWWLLVTFTSHILLLQGPHLRARQQIKAILHQICALWCTLRRGAKKSTRLLFIAIILPWELFGPSPPFVPLSLLIKQNYDRNILTFVVKLVKG